MAERTRTPRGTRPGRRAPGANGADAPSTDPSPRGTGGKLDEYLQSVREVEIRTRTPRTINVDGELGPRTPARIIVVPRSLSVFSP